MSANAEQSTFWQELAPDWIAATEHSDIVAAPFGVAAMGLLELTAGQTVVDIGCGTGSTTLELARRVAPGGSAVGVDISPALVAAAEDQERTQAVGNVSFRIADAQEDAFAPGDFSAAYSRFGVMFFADPSAAFANIRRALRADGVLAFSCWQSIFENEWMFVPGSAVVTVTGALPPMPGPDEPGPFSLADADLIRAVLTDAGFRSVEIEPHSHPVELPETKIESLVALTQRVGPVREALRTADADTAARIEAAVRDALVARLDGGTVRLSAGAHLVRARA
ncbi:MAG: methyltransferase domain-containing protein [Acidimicrobiia bacterium]